MKKIFSGALLAVGLFSLVGSTFAASDCKEVEFPDGTVCVSIEKTSDTKFKLVVDDDEIDGSLRCNISLPGYNDNSNAGFLAWSTWSDCNQAFTYDYDKYNNDEATVKIYIRVNEEYPSDREDKPSSNSQWTFPQWEYSFADEEWTDNNNYDDDDDNNSSNGDLDSFSISLSDSTPSLNDEVTLTIKAFDNDDDTISDYDGSNAEVSVEYRSSSSSSWKTASSTYFSIDDKTPNFSNGKATTDITFKKDYDYRITVSDDDEDVDSNKIFYIGGSSSSSSSNGDLDSFDISLSDSTPSLNDEVTLTIKAFDNDDDTISDYDGSNAEVSVEYRSSSSSSWKTASSTYFSIDDKTPNFSNGKATTDITFKKDYDYRITVSDDDEDVDSNKIFYIGGSSSSSSSNGDLDSFDISLSDSTPSLNDEVTLTIKAFDNDDDTISDYDGSNAEVSVEYRSSSSSSWKTASSTYFSIDDKTPNFSNGKATTDITFKKDYDYRITVSDDDEDVDSNKIFYIGGSSSSSSSNGDLDSFDISLSDSTPSLNREVTLTIKAYDNDDDTISDYDGSNAEVSVEYRSSSSSSWKTASSTYFSIDDKTPNFSNGKATTDITFKKDYDYRIVVSDDDEDVDSNKIFYVGGSSSSSSSNGFSSKEMDTVEELYDRRDSMIDDLENKYSKLRNSSTWKNKSDIFYDDMKDVIDDEDDREFEDYDDFNDAFAEWYSYTNRIK